MTMRFYMRKMPLPPLRKRRRRPSPPALRLRIAFLAIIFIASFAIIGARLVHFGLHTPPPSAAALIPPSVARPNIVDRNGTVLAMDIPVASIYAEPRRLVDINEAVEGLTSVFPDLSPAELYRRFDTDRGFVWVKRKIPLATKNQVWNLGIPSVGFREETQRLYPNGDLASHVLGAVNTDNIGIAGIEKWIDGQGLQILRDTGLKFDANALHPIELSMDLRAQFILKDELRKAMDKFSAIAAAGLILDVTNGEVVALVSLPDFNPNIPSDALRSDRINRISVGTFEMGSTFKALTTAMALDSGAFNLNSVIDASQPLRLGRSTISDFRGQKRPLTLPEAFIHSSNIAMGRMALTVGKQAQQNFLKKMGQFDRLTTELPESAVPILPPRWGDINTVTVAFGHGMAVTPLQASMAIASLINGGRLIQPTFIKGTPVEDRILANNVITAKTGETLRFLMRLNAEIGSARGGNVAGFYIGGKTGTAEKVVGGRYSKERVLTSFMSVTPIDNPKYLFLTILDEPKGLPETYGFRTSGWNAVPVTGSIMARALPVLGVSPRWSPPERPFPVALSAGAWGAHRFTPVAAERYRAATQVLQ